MSEIMVTDAQLEHQWKYHRSRSRRADNPIDSQDSLDWLNKLGQDNDVILIGEGHWIEVTAAIEVEMVKALTEQADYRQVVLEYPYSFTPLFDAYVRIESDQEAFEFFNKYLSDRVIFPTNMVLLNSIRDFNRRQPDSPISVLTTDVEHTLYYNEYYADAGNAGIQALREEYSSLTEAQFPTIESHSSLISAP